MMDEKVIFSGELTDFSAITALGENLLTELYLYQDIHLLNGNALFLDNHISIIQESYKLLFKKDIALSLRDKISSLVECNRMQTGSYALRLYLWQDNYLITNHKRLLYDGFTIWHDRPEGVLIQCENPLLGISCSVSLMAAEFGNKFAGQGRVAIRENLDGVITGVGDHPVFCIVGSEVITTPLNYGVNRSVERQLAFDAIAQSGYKLTERPILSSEITSFEEVFYCDTQGITALGKFRWVNLLPIASGIIANNYGQEKSERCS